MTYNIPIHGILLLDKPPGLSSNNALMKVKYLLRAQKAGHIGTLDPFATGLLPLCFGEATKFSQNLLEADKTYEAIIHLGIVTQTGDIDGTILHKKTVNIMPTKIKQVLKQFHGKLEQIPPMFSALKYKGKPLYKYAREGITIKRKARQITIRTLTLLSYKPPYLQIQITCSKGTYIRVLGEEIGVALGCGAHLHKLRRISVGLFTLTNRNIITLDQFISYNITQRLQTLLPIDSLLKTLPTIILNDNLTARFLHGQRLALNKENILMSTQIGLIKVYHESTKRLLGIGFISTSGILIPKRLISVFSKNKSILPSTN